jgi:hypothetical protein
MPLVIKVENQGTNKIFKVIIDPKGGGNNTSFSIECGTGPVKAVALPTTMRDIKAPLSKRGLLCEFTVATNHVEDAKFLITYYYSTRLGSRIVPDAGFTRYWFYLKDFAYKK